MILARQNSATTLTEVVVATGVSTLILAALLVASISVQKSCGAAVAYATAKDDQMRISDYLARDVRRAISATAASNVSVTTIISGTAGNASTTATVPSLLTLTIPDYYGANGNPRDPSYVNGLITYGTTPKTIRYFLIGNSFYREEGGTAQGIANDVGNFTVTEQDLNTNVGCKITFLPAFTLNTAQSSGTAATTTFATTFLRNAVARQ